MSDKAVTFLVHSLAGAGKTTLGATAPKPLLIFDVETASRYVKGVKKKWDPLTEAPPIYDGTWEICVINVNRWEKAVKAFEYLKSGQHNFKSIMVDSISELQGKAQEYIKGREQLQMQDWGRMLNAMAFFCKDLRDLAQDDPNIEALYITAMTKDYNGIFRPFLQGQVKDQIPYWFDVVGYLYVEKYTKEDGTPGEYRRLLIGDADQYEAKSRVPNLPPILDNPNIEFLVNYIWEEIMGNKVQEEYRPTPAEQKPVAQPVEQVQEVPEEKATPRGRRQPMVAAPPSN